MKRNRSTAVERDLCFRAIPVRSGSIDEEKRTIEATISTETPVSMYDWQRDEFIPEVLLSKGAVWPNQMPLLDSHNRWSLEDQLGSVRNIRRETNEIAGRLSFSRQSEDAWEKVKEGHITDVSVGYRIEDRTYIPKGESKTIEGRTFAGPVNVVTKWRIYEVSLVPIGADEQAKLRGWKQPAANRNGVFMNEKLKALCIAKGMPPEATDDEAQRWLAKQMETLCDEQNKAAAHPPKAEPAGMSEPPPKRDLDGDEFIRLFEEADKKREARQKEEKKARRKLVNDLCELAGISPRADFHELEDETEIRAAILEARKNQHGTVGSGIPIYNTESGSETHRAAMQTAITMRALESAGATPEKVKTLLPEAERSKHAEEFRYKRLIDIAKDCLRLDGVDLRSKSDSQVAEMAIMGTAHSQRAGGEAYHVSSNFANLLLDAVNKSMMVGYTQAPSTWRGPMRQGASSSDFKDIHRIRIGAVPNIPVWLDNKDPAKLAVTDAKEKYAVEARSAEISFSWKSLINDDMDQLSRFPAQLGDAMARTINAFAWKQITDNPTMTDGVALFSAVTGNRKRSNLTTGAGAPSVTTLQTLSNLMRQMRGENTPEEAESDDILNLSPAYIVGPSALDTTIKQLVLSAYDPAANSFMVYNTAAQLIPVIEPLLDVNSATAWYLFAAPARIDTVELSFLTGQETPWTRPYVDPKNLSACWTILQTFGAKAMNHRGIQKHAGA